MYRPGMINSVELLQEIGSAGMAAVDHECLVKKPLSFLARLIPANA